MSLQVFLQAHLLGTHDFLAHNLRAEESGESDLMAGFQGRCAWLNLFCEVIPRALLSELSLSSELLGSASAEQFLLVLAEESIGRANELLTSVAEALTSLSGGKIRLVWATTEDLGSWPVARKRLDDAFASRSANELSLAKEPLATFAPFESGARDGDSAYFEQFAAGLLAAHSVGWSPDEPARLQWDSGRYTWPLAEQSTPGGIVFARRIAQDDFSQPASAEELGTRAEGASKWGILLSDVDHFDALLRAQPAIGDHIHLSVLFKEFFAGELSVLCTLPEFWRKVTVLYRGGDSFAVLGSWDALLSLAREIQRLFARFVADNLGGAPTSDGQTISMALAISEDDRTGGASTVFAEAALRLREAKAAGVDTFHLFGRTLEWKRLPDAEELKTSLVRLVNRYGYSPDYIHDLAAVYRESSIVNGTTGGRRKASRIDRPWRTYLRLAQVIPQERGKEVNNLRNAVIGSLIGKRTTALKLRPSGRVGLEWARLATGD